MDESSTTTLGERVRRAQRGDEAEVVQQVEQFDHADLQRDALALDGLVANRDRLEVDIDIDVRAEMGLQLGPALRRGQADQAF